MPRFAARVLTLREGHKFAGDPPRRSEIAATTMAATAATSGPPAHRYTSMLAEKELAKFHHTFSTFDRDGGGDVDINELGVMFRQLGHRPSDAEMREMIYAVDADSSGTIDFEEFCLLQLRVKRSTNTPKWLQLALASDDDGEAPAEDGPPTRPTSRRTAARPSRTRSGCSSSPTCCPTRATCSPSTSQATASGSGPSWRRSSRARSSGATARCSRSHSRTITSATRAPSRWRARSPTESSRRSTSRTMASDRRAPTPF